MSLREVLAVPAMGSVFVLASLKTRCPEKCRGVFGSIPAIGGGVSAFGGMVGRLAESAPAYAEYMAGMAEAVKDIPELRAEMVRVLAVELPRAEVSSPPAMWEAYLEGCRQSEALCDMIREAEMDDTARAAFSAAMAAARGSSPQTQPPVRAPAQVPAPQGA